MQKIFGGIKMKMSNNELNKVLKKEAFWSFGTFIVYLAWVFITAYLFRNSDVRVLGFPLWFFLSSIVGWIVFAIATNFIVKKVFVEIDFDDYTK